MHITENAKEETDTLEETDIISYQIKRGIHQLVNYTSEIYTDGNIQIDEELSKKYTEEIDDTENLNASIEVGIIKDAKYAYLIDGQNPLVKSCLTRGWLVSIVDIKSREVVFQLGDRFSPEYTYESAIQAASIKLHELIINKNE